MAQRKSKTLLASTTSINEPTRRGSKNEESQADIEETKAKSGTPRRSSRRLSGAFALEKNEIDDVVDKKLSGTPPVKRTRKAADKLKKIDEVESETKAAGKEASDVPKAKRLDTLRKEGELASPRRRSRRLSGAGVSEDDAVVVTPAKQGSEKVADLGKIEEVVEDLDSKIPLKKRKYEMKIEPEVDTVEVTSEKEVVGSIIKNVPEDVDVEVLKDDGVVKKDLPDEKNGEESLDMKASEEMVETGSKIEATIVAEAEQKIKSAEEKIEENETKPLVEEEAEKDDKIKDIIEKETELENKMDLTEINEVPVVEKEKIVDSDNTEPAVKQSLPEEEAFELENDVNITKVPTHTENKDADEPANADLEVDNMSLISTLQQTENSNSTDTVEATKISPEAEAKEVAEGGDEFKLIEGATESIVTDVSKGTNYNKSETKLKENMLVKAEYIPKQKPKSGKFWKASRSQFNSVKKDQGPRLTFEQRVKRKEEKDRAKELAEMLVNRKIQRKQEMKDKIEANKKKKEENERRAEVYQVIKNPAKIKRMKKKQLRLLAKRDTVDMKTHSVLAKA